MPPEKKSRAFPTGNALLYILLLSVALIASFTSSAILNNLFAICNSRLLPTNRIVNCDGRVRPIQGAPCFCFIVVGGTSKRIYRFFFSLAASWLVLRCSTIWANHSTIAGSS